MSDEPVGGASGEEGGEWLPVADLMAGLMLVFLVLAVSFMLRVEQESEELEQRQEAVERLAEAHSLVRRRIHEELVAEFATDLDDWRAEIDADALSLRFFEPDVLFERGQAELRPRFVEILDDFFPRYLRVLRSESLRDHVQEVRIEGHTSSYWNRTATPEEAYVHNMELSQDRTRAVLSHLMGLVGPEAQGWLQTRLTANGLSSSKPVLDDEGREDPLRSRRVEFRLRTDAETQIARILSELGRRESDGMARE
ncbi:MAG: OmpA family protein [Acidobacteriota bacterium]